MSFVVSPQYENTDTLVLEQRLALAKQIAHFETLLGDVGTTVGVLLNQLATVDHEYQTLKHQADLLGAVMDRPKEVS